MRRPMSALSRRLAMLAIAAAIASGCASDKTGWRYDAEPLAAGEPVAEVDLTLPTFADRRDGEDQGSLYLSMVPLVPYAETERVRPEESWPADDFMPPVDLARALAEEIESARLFWNELRVDLALRRANEPEVLWSFSVDERLQDTIFMHDLPLVPFHYDEPWKRAMEKVIPSLREAAANL
jgi:hypothetical protein